MRLLYVSQYYPPEVGATQTRAQEMVEHLVAAGHQVTVLAEVPNHPVGIVQPAYRRKLYKRSWEAGVDVIRVAVRTSPQKSFRTRLLFYLSFMVNAIGAGLVLARGRYDLIYATSPPLFVGGVALALNALRRTPFVFEVRDLWPESAVAMGELRNPTFVRWAAWLEELCYNRAQYIVTVTRGIADRLVERGIPSSKLSVIPNGANTDLFHPMPEAGNEIRSGLHLEGRFVVVYAGLLGLAQGLHNVIEAARLLQREPVHFLFVGDGPMRASLQDLADGYGLSNVSFTGVVPRRQVPHYLSAADLAIVIFADRPLFTRSVPSKMFDALACECPVLLSAPEGEASAVLEDSGGGIHVPPESPAAIADEILHLRLRSDQRKLLGRQGRQFVVRNYSRQAQAVQLETLLQAMGES